MLHLSQRHRHRGPPPRGKNQFAAFTVHLSHQELRTAHPVADGHSPHVVGIYLVDRVIEGAKEINAGYRIRDIFVEADVEQDPRSL